MMVEFDEPHGVRLQKVLSQAGIASRRVAERMITDGRVEVDGELVTELGTRVDPDLSVIRVDGARVMLDDSLVYLALNKPRGMHSTMSDDRGRPCIGDLVEHRVRSTQKLFHVGRLDADTEGLILLTNDGELAHRLMHPSYEVPKTYLATVADHGFNASTFAARVIVSTGSDFVSAVTGAIGALKGPLHGGAPGPALDMVFEIGDASRAEAVLRRKLESGERLMGFGHRVYKVRDPRADVLAAAAARMFTRAGDVRLYELARAVEAQALDLLEEYKPGRRLKTNVEFYTALLLCGLGLETAFFAPTFAIGRVAGWTAHCFEQRALGRLIRPQSAYVGRVPA